MPCHPAPRRFAILRCALGLSAALGATLAHGPARAEPAAREQQLDFGAITVSRFTLPRAGGPVVQYYLSRPAARAPLVLYVQGSGCAPVFGGLGTPNRFSTIFSWLPLAQQGNHAVMAVDKPHLPSESRRDMGGTASACGQAFNDYFSFDTWLDTLKLAVRHALRQPYVDPTRVLVIGISEGAPMAAALARDLPEIGNVVLLGSSGPSQLFDFLVGAYRDGQGDEDTLRRLREIDAVVADINAHPKSTDKFAWGHAYLRWSSFFAQSTVNDLLRSKARVYLASGMRDTSVPILSTEVIYAQLRAQGRDVTFRRVPFANHALQPEGAPFPEVQKEYDAFMAWFSRR